MDPAEIVPYGRGLGRPVFHDDWPCFVLVLNVTSRLCVPELTLSPP